MSLTEKRKRELEKYFWFVSARESFLQSSLTEHLSTRFGITNAEMEGVICYKGKDVPGLHTGQRFSVVEWLALNRGSIKGFTIYHSNFRDGPWEKWKEGLKTSAEKVQRTPIARKIRTRKIHKRPATSFRQR